MQSGDDLSGDEMLQRLSALAHPQRLRIIAALAGGRNYVSQLARDLGMNRTLLHMHLRRLSSAGLVIGSLELSKDGKAMKYYDAAPFVLHLTPQDVRRLTETLTSTDGPPA